jgi:Tfp pilus assembly protein PilN
MSIINLLPSDYLRRRQQQRVNVGFVALFGIVMAAVLSAAAVSKERLASIEGTLKKVDAEYAEATKTIDQLQQLEVQKRQMQLKADVAASLLERTPRSTVLAVVAQARPEHTMLTEFDLYTKRIVLAVPEAKSKTAKPKATDKGQAEEPEQVILSVDLEITGWARTDLEVAGFITALDRSKLAKHVELAYSREKKFNEGTVREFKIILELDPKANAMDIAQLARQQAPAPAPVPTPSRSLIRTLLGEKS